MWYSFTFVSTELLLSSVETNLSGAQLFNTGAATHEITEILIFQVSSHFSMTFSKCQKFHDSSMIIFSFSLFPGALGIPGLKN